MIIQHDFQLSNTLWYKIGGIAKYYLQANSKEDILQAVEFIQKKNIDTFFICGQGSNLIFTDEYYDGAVIQIGHTDKKQVTQEGNTIKSFAGEILGEVIEYSLDRNLTGLEWAGGLPGTIGAAVRGNVGAFGGEIKDTLKEVEILIIKDDGSFETKIFSNEELNFSYRHSLIKENQRTMIALSATFQLMQASTDDILKAKAIYARNIQYRKEKHPLEYPNGGSVFKNIRKKEQIEKVLQVFPDLKEKVETQWYGKVAAGHLIQRLELQGLQIGDAQISNKHALFIVNLGHATATDVLTIINTIQSKFMETFGFSLEPEVEIVQ